MLFSLGHGQRIVIDKSGLESGVVAGAVAKGAVIALSKVVDDASGSLESGATADGVGQSFGYLFSHDQAPGDERPGLADKLSALAAAMVEPAVAGGSAEDADENSDIPPIFTYLGQFIDHDITANTDRDVMGPDGELISTVTGAKIDPLPRDRVVEAVVNLRNGSLRLDSLYGDGPFETQFTQKVKGAMRDPEDRAQMRVGKLEVINFGEPIPLPADGKADLPRLGDVLADGASGLTETDIDALTDEDLKATFKKDGVVQNWHAVIGDMRNDENLIVAQLHLAFLRFHNAVAKSLGAAVADAEERFERAPDHALDVSVAHCQRIPADGLRPRRGRCGKGCRGAALHRFPRARRTRRTRVAAAA